MIPCLVSFRSTLRRTPKSHAIRPFRAASPTLPILCHPPLSVHPIFRRLFQVPYPVTPLFATLTKTARVWGYSSHFGTARSVLPVSSCNRPASSPLNATLMRIPASVDSKWLTVALTLSDATLTKNTGGVCGPYLFTSLLHCFVFVPSVPLRRKHFGATIRKGARFLCHPGKQLRSPRCLRLVSGHRGQLDLGPQRKSCLGPAF